MSTNVIVISGNITRDIDLRSAGDKSVCDMTVAVNTGYGDKKKTAFVDCTVWGKTADNCAKYLSKGRPVTVTGRLEQDNWKDKDTGGNRSKLKVVANQVEFGYSDDKQESKPQQQRQQETTPQQREGYTPTTDDFDPDSVPF